MIMESENFKKVKALGLNTYEVKIWTALLSRGVSTAGELSDIANVPRSRSYDVLESLEKKGFVVMKLGKPIKYLAVAPKEVLERVKEQIEAKTKIHISGINENSFTSMIKDLQKSYDKTQKDADTIAVLKGPNLQRHILFLSGNAKKDIVVAQTNKNDSVYSALADEGKNKNINLVKHNTGFRLLLFDQDDSIVIPISEDDVHPDYNFGLWVKNRELNSFFKNLIRFA